MRVVPRGAELQAARALDRLAGQAGALLAHAYFYRGVARAVPAPPPGGGPQGAAQALPLQRAALPILAAEVQQTLRFYALCTATAETAARAAL